MVSTPFLTAGFGVSVARMTLKDTAPKPSAKHLRTIDLAEAFGVDVTTIRNWGKTLGLPSEMLPTGQRRYELDKVRAWYRSILERNGEQP